MTKVKKNHSPADIAVFSMLNSSVIGLLYCVSLFHKSFEESKLPLKSKFYFILRNTITISLIYSMNQYFRQYFSLKENREKLKNKIHIKNDTAINLIRSFVSALVPFSFGYAIYFFKNKNEHISRSVFAIWGLSTLFVELTDLNKNKCY
jgi:hypothetical protein